MKGKVAPHRFSQVHLQKMHDDFLSFLGSLNDKDQLLPFLEGLLTKSEMVMCARRVEIAKMLLQGSPFTTIQKKLKVGQKTIESVDHWLSSFHEYRTAFGDVWNKHLHNKDYFPDSFKAFRKKYPIHFMLFNLLLDGK